MSEEPQPEARQGRSSEASRARTREEMINHQLVLAAQKLNAMLENHPLCTHLIPIDTENGDDLAEKVRDGILLCSFLASVRGEEKLIEIEKLNLPKLNADGTFGKLNNIQISQNLDLMLKSAKSVGVSTKGVGIMNLLDGKNNKQLVARFVQDIISYEMISRLKNVAKGTVGPSALNKLNRQASVDSEDVIISLKNFVNERLAKCLIPEKLAEGKLSELLQDGRIYVKILSASKPDMFSEDLMKIPNLEERADAIVGRLKRLQPSLFIDGYDLVHGDDHVHVEFLTNCAEVISPGFARLVQEEKFADEDVEIQLGDGKSSERLPSTKDLSVSKSSKRQKSEGNIISSILGKFSRKNSEHSINRQDSEKSYAGSQKSRKGSQRKKSDDLGNIFATENKNIISKFFPSKSEQVQPLNSSFNSEGNLKSKVDAEKEKTTQYNEGNSSGIQSALISYAAPSPSEESEDDGVIHVKSGVGIVHRKRYRILAFTSFCAGLVLLILSGVVFRNIEHTVHSNLESLIPIKNSNLKFLNSSNSTIKFYAYDYDNLKSASEGMPLSVALKGPYVLRKRTIRYNGTFKPSFSGGRYAFLERHEFIAENLTAMLGDEIRSPSLQYISAMGSNYLNKMIMNLGDSIEAIRFYFASSMIPELKLLCIPLYLNFVSRNSINYMEAIQKWSNRDDVLLGGFPIHQLHKSISLNSALYIYNSSSKFSLRKYSSSVYGIFGWVQASKNASLKNEIIQDILKSSGYASDYDIIYSWITSVTESSSYFSYVKNELISSGIISHSDGSFLNSMSSIAFLQFAHAELIPFLTSSQQVSVCQIGFFPRCPFEDRFEMALYLKQYDSNSYKKFNISLIETFFELFSDDDTLSSFLSSVSMDEPFKIEGFLNFGIDLKNSKPIASYLKHIIRMVFYKSAGIGSVRNIPPLNSSYPGLFVLRKVFDFFRSSNDSNVKSDLGSLSFIPNPFFKSYKNNNEHFKQNYNNWCIRETGNSNLSATHELSHVNGVSQILGKWKENVKITGLRDFVSAEPIHEESPIKSWKVWDENLKRGVEYFTTGSSSNIGDFKVLRYEPNNDYWKNEISNPSNNVFFMKGPDGLFNMEQIYGGSPIWLSFPHFLNAGSSVHDSFVSNVFSPSKSEHYPFVDVEPLTGMVFRYSNRYQLNLKISKIDWFSEPGYSELFKSKDSFYAPVFWWEESYEIPSERLSELHDGIIRVRNNGLRDTILLAVFGSILVLASLYIFIKLRRSPNKHIIHIEEDHQTATPV